MRAFIVLALVAAASAGTLPGGYRYGVGHSGTFSAPGANLGAPLGVTLGAPLAAPLGATLGATEAFNTPVGFLGAGSGLIGSTSNINTGFGSLVNGLSYGIGDVAYGNGGLAYNNGGFISSGATNIAGLNPLDTVPTTVEQSKQFFHFSAPAEHYNEGIIRNQLSNVLKKNLQVVFIKAPENTAATNAALQLAKQAVEQKTAIYVLSKENDASEVVAQLQDIQQNVQTAPEVRFIKYRTEEDIANAKNSIQSQYDSSILGTSQNFDGGVAPVLNYASKVVNIDGLKGVNYGTGLNIVSSGSAVLDAGSAYSNVADSVVQSGGIADVVVAKTGSEYLPPAVLKK